MDRNSSILVVGAGAGGLAFALECADRGMPVRIIDKRPYRALIGKATGVAAGVWRGLSKYGVSPAAVASAMPMSRFVFYDDGELVADVPVPLIDGAPAAYLYPQGELEKYLEAALSKKGINVEYSTEFLSFEDGDDGVCVTLNNARGEIEQIDQLDWLIGADGAHSVVRDVAEIPFVGRDYPENWSVAEVTTRQWSTAAQAQLFLQSDGVGLFLSQPSAGVVQGILNAETAAEALLSRFPDAELQYQRQFNVSLKRARTPRKGRVWLIGDAAHVQSPVGGQGLNLAVWDGVKLAEGLLCGDLGVETTLARRARRVLFFTDFDYRMLATQSPILRSLRNQYWGFAAKHPAIAKWFFKIISGIW